MMDDLMMDSSSSSDKDWLWLSDGLRLTAALSQFLTSEEKRRRSDPSCLPLPPPPDLSELLCVLKQRGGDRSLVPLEPSSLAASPRRLSRVSFGNLSLQERDFVESRSLRGSSSSSKIRPSSASFPGVSPDDPSPVNGGWQIMDKDAITNLNDALIGEYSKSLTDTLVQFESRLESGWMKDEQTLKDIVRSTWLLGFLVENVLQVLSAVVTTALNLLTPAWAPFAVARMVGISLGAERWEVASLWIMGVRATSLFVFYAILAMDCNFTTVKLLLAKARLTISLHLGLRLVYTVAAISFFPHVVNIIWLIEVLFGVVFVCLSDAVLVTQMFRYSEDSYTSLHSASAVGFLSGSLDMFTLVVEVARHFAVLNVAPDGIRAYNLLPEKTFGNLMISNVHVMNFTFTASIVLMAKSLFERFRSEGKTFSLINSRVNVRPVYGKRAYVKKS